MSTIPAPPPGPATVPARVAWVLWLAQLTASLPEAHRA